MTPAGVLKPITRADRQHAQVLAGDDRGVYGDYPAAACDPMICAWLSKWGRRRRRRSAPPSAQGIIEPGTSSDDAEGHDWMFEQHARWLEELHAYTERKETVTCRAGYMTLTAITQEIAASCTDPRPQGETHHIYNWQSMAADLFDSLAWIGPELLALVDTAARAIHHAITNDLLVPRPPSARRPQFVDAKRTDIAALTAVLATVLDQDDVLVAAWRDLVAGCRDINHNLYPGERIAFLRDTLVGLSEYRRQDRRFFSPISTAVSVLIGYQSSVQQAQAMVGDPVDDDTSPYNPQAKSGMTEADRDDLAARCILERPQTGDYVVWFVSARATSSGKIPA